MFILVRSGGQWEDSWKENVAVSASKIKLERYQKRLEEEDALHASNQEKISEYMNTLEDTFRDIDQEDPIPRPKWKAGLAESEITPEMRKQRDEIDEQNRLIHERNTLKINEWYAKREQAMKEYALSLGIPETEVDLYDMYGRVEGVYYDIEEVAEI